MEYDPIDSEELLSRMRSLNKKFKNACNQVILLNNQIEHLQVRYDRAVQSNKRSYRYFLRLRLATLEGIRNMFYEYACRRADQLDEMQDQLVQEGVIDSDYDMDDDADSETDSQWNSAMAGMEEGENAISSPEGAMQWATSQGGVSVETHRDIQAVQRQAMQGVEATGNVQQADSSGGVLWTSPPQNAALATVHPQFSGSENTLSNQGSSDEETFPIERPVSPESMTGAAASDVGLLSVSESGAEFCSSELDTKAYARLSPVKPGSASKTITAIGEKLVQVSATASSSARAFQAGQSELSGSQSTERVNSQLAETTTQGHSGSMEQSAVKKLNLRENKGSSTLLKMRGSQEVGDAPRRAKAARLNDRS